MTYQEVACFCAQLWTYKHFSSRRWEIHSFALKQCWSAKFSQGQTILGGTSLRWQLSLFHFSFLLFSFTQTTRLGLSQETRFTFKLVYSSASLLWISRMFSSFLCNEDMPCCFSPFLTQKVNRILLLPETWIIVNSWSGVDLQSGFAEWTCGVDLRKWVKWRKTNTAHD